MPLPAFLRTSSRDPGSTARVKRRCRPDVTRLEGRTVMNASVISLAASPETLWPPNGRLVPVRVSGLIAETEDTDVGANFRVIDEYGAIQPSGPVALTDEGGGTFSYDFTVQLQASRLGQDRDGRLYTILVDAFDDDSSNGAATVVTVPHDRGRGNDGPSRGDGDAEDRGGRRADTPKRGKGRGGRDLVPIGRGGDGPGRGFDDGPGKSKDKGKGRGRD